MASENIISKAIVQNYAEKLSESLKVDVALVGAGPSALVAASLINESNASKVKSVATLLKFASA